MSSWTDFNYNMEAPQNVDKNGDALLWGLAGSSKAILSYSKMCGTRFFIFMLVLHIYICRARIHACFGGPQDAFQKIDITKNISGWHFALPGTRLH